MAWNLAGLSLLAPVVAPLAGKLIDVFGVSRRLKTASPFVEKLLASLTGLIMIGIFLMLIAGVAFCGLIAGLYIWIAPNSGPLAATLVAVIVVVAVVCLSLYAARKLWRNVRQNIDMIANDGRERHSERDHKPDDHKPEGVIHAFAEGFKAGRKL
jgi:uncharacterized membrane protein